MKKILIVVIATLLASTLVSCIIDEHDECMKCMKDLKKTLDKEAPSNLDEAIAVYDFALAHKYYACYLNYDNTDNKEEAGERLFRAEASYLLSKGETDKTESLAKEMKMTEIYNELLAEAIPSMIKAKKYDEVVSILASWPFQYSYNTELIDFDIYYIAKTKEDTKWSSFHCDDHEKNNVSYNKEMTAYNTIVDNLLAAAILDEDVALIKKCMKLYGPLASVKSKVQQKGYSSNHYDIKFELKNTYRDDAMKEVKAAGIKL